MYIWLPNVVAKLLYYILLNNSSNAAWLVTIADIPRNIVEGEPMLSAAIENNSRDSEA